MPIYDAFGRPVRTGMLKQELAGPTVSGVRSILSDHPAQGLTPARLASLLLEAETGDARAYLELAEEIEEKLLHYTSVMGTRKRQVTQLNITVKPAGESAEEKRDADLVQEWLESQTLEDELFDVMDAVGKGYSVSEIMWDFTERQWVPKRLEWRFPQWFEFDYVDGRTLKKRSLDNELQELEPFKFVTHRFRAKSGLTVRGGFARLVGWWYLYANYVIKDWVQFIETFGQPIRVGKYPPNATEQEKAVLLRGLTNAGVDFAAMIPESMQMEFVGGSGAPGGNTTAGSVHQGFLGFADALVSKLVLGQTLTTEAGDKGARSLGEVHDEVRHDIERSDATALGQTLTRDIVVPIVALNHGERKRYPRIVIGREETIDIARVSDALAKLVPLGLQVSARSVREKFGFEEPDDENDVLRRPQQAEPGGDPDEDDDEGRKSGDNPDEDENAGTRAVDPPFQLPAGVRTHRTRRSMN